MNPEDVARVSVCLDPAGRLDYVYVRWLDGHTYRCRNRRGQWRRRLRLDHLPEPCHPLAPHQAAAVLASIMDGLSAGEVYLYHGRDTDPPPGLGQHVHRPRRRRQSPEEPQR